ncbi:MAG: family 4 glycosyl hydrolase [Anaerolineae bacterium]
MARIAFIGGGSLTWIPRFTHDLLRAPELAGSTIVLMDVDAKALEMMGAYCRAIIAESGGDLEVETTIDRDQAIEGADSVVSTFMAGGHRAWAEDLNIILKHGIQHPKGMSVGPGGLIQGLKAISQMLSLTSAMERLCPRAPLFNYSNPNSTISLAVQRHSRIQSVGICPGITIAMDWFSQLLGMGRDELVYRAAGVNHCNWVLSVRHRDTGDELLPSIVEKINQMPRPQDPTKAREFDAQKISAELYRLFGGVPIPGDFHVSEFFPYFLRPGVDLFEAYGLLHNHVENRIAVRAKYTEEIEAFLASQASLPPIRSTRPVGSAAPKPRGESHEKLEWMIVSAMRNQGLVYHLNVINNGAITNVRPDICVEVPTMVDSFGFHPVHFGELPPAIAGWTSVHGAVQDLTVRAAVEGDRTQALQALLLDPMCYHLEIPRIEAMVDELLEANRDWLPEFYTRR